MTKRQVASIIYDDGTRLSHLEPSTEQGVVVPPWVVGTNYGSDAATPANISEYVDALEEALHDIARQYGPRGG